MFHFSIIIIFVNCLSEQVLSIAYRKKDKIYVYALSRKIQKLEWYYVSMLLYCFLLKQVSYMAIKQKIIQGASSDIWLHINMMENYFYFINMMEKYFYFLKELSCSLN